VGHSLQVTHAAKYPAPILSMGVSPDCTTLAVGTSSGLLSIRQRKKPDKLDAGTATALGVARPRRPRKLHPNNYRYFLRGGAESAAVCHLLNYTVPVFDVTIMSQPPFMLLFCSFSSLKKMDYRCKGYLIKHDCANDDYG
jgi:hypothetical protein